MDLDNNQMFDFICENGKNVQTNFQIHCFLNGHNVCVHECNLIVSIMRPLNSNNSLLNQMNS